MEYYWTSIHYYEAGRTDWTRSEKKKKKEKEKENRDTAGPNRN